MGRKVSENPNHGKKHVQQCVWNNSKKYIQVCEINTKYTSVWNKYKINVLHRKKYYVIKVSLKKCTSNFKKKKFYLKV